MPITTSSSLVDALRRYQLLGPQQLKELQGLQESMTDPKALANELLQRGWLTAFQVNQLLQDKGEGLLLGSYVLLQPLGQGGMGQVFKARNRKLGKVVALKLIHKDRVANAGAVKRFQREVRAAAQLNHPNVVVAYDADQVAGTHLLVMEYVEGTDLAKVVQERGPLPVDQACDFIRQAALGLQHAHERGLVHRDIKPSNLLLTTRGAVVKILDMGLARRDQAVDDDKSTVTQEGAVLGTPDFMAPEQAREAHTVDIRADLYSLGCTLYYLLTGQPPFPTGTLGQKLLKHVLDEPEPVEQLRRDVPPDVAAVVRKLMAKKPEDRFQTPAEVATALTAINYPSLGLASTANDPTLPEGGQLVRPDASRQDTLNSALGSMELSDTAESVESPHQQRKEAARRHWLRYNVAGGVFLLMGVGVVLVLILQSQRGAKPVTKAAPLVIATVRSSKPSVKVEDAWLKQVATLPAEQQVEVVAARLKACNPGFDGTVTHQVENGVVTELRFCADNVTDIAPVRGLAGLKSLFCAGSDQGTAKLTDLSPLRGMSLTSLTCAGTQVSNLWPLKGMPLTTLNLAFTKVTDLSPLKGMMLTVLDCHGVQVTDLSPLKGMPLTNLMLWGSPVSDLTPLKGMPLKWLNCGAGQVSDLSPLKGMHLEFLSCAASKVSDLKPLQGMPLLGLGCDSANVTDLSPLKGLFLKELTCDFKPERDAEILRSLKTLEKINDRPVQEFWKEVEAKQGEKKP